MTKHERELEIRRKLGIPPSASLQVVDMGEGVVEPRTEGWTDAQIKDKSLQQLETMISQGMKGVEGLQKALTEQLGRVTSLQKIRDRKLIVGGK